MPTKESLQNSLESLITGFIKSPEHDPQEELINNIVKALKLDHDDLLPNPYPAFFSAEHMECDEVIKNFLKDAKKDYKNTHVFGAGHGVGKKILVIMSMAVDVIAAPLVAAIGAIGKGFEKLGDILGGGPEKPWSFFRAPAKIINTIGWGVRCAFLKNGNDTGLAEKIYNKYRPISSCVDKLIKLNPRVLERENLPYVEEVAKNERPVYALGHNRSFVKMVEEQRARKSSIEGR